MWARVMTTTAGEPRMRMRMKPSPTGRRTAPTEPGEGKLPSKQQEPAGRSNKNAPELLLLPKGRWS